MRPAEPNVQAQMEMEIHRMQIIGLISTEFGIAPVNPLEQAIADTDVPIERVVTMAEQRAFTQGETEGWLERNQG